MVYGSIFYIEYGEIGMENEEELVNEFLTESTTEIRTNIKKYFGNKDTNNNYINENEIDMEITYALERLLSTLKI